MDNNGIQIAKMQQDIQHTKETNQRIESKLDAFINKAETTYATKNEMCRTREEQEKKNDEQDTRIMRQEIFLTRILWAVAGTAILFVLNLLKEVLFTNL